MKNWLSAKIGLKSSNDSTANQIIKKHIKFNSSNSANVCIYRYCNAQVLIKRHLIHFCHRMNPDHSVNWILIETSELLTERESFVIQSHYSEYSVILYWKIQSSFTKKKINLQSCRHLFRWLRLNPLCYTDVFLPTAGSPPSAPGGVRVVYREASFIVTWDVPRQTYGTVTNYVVPVTILPEANQTVYRSQIPMLILGMLFPYDIFC